MILICTLCVLCFAGSIWGDRAQRNTARKYLGELPEIRKAVIRQDMTDSYARQSLLYAHWQHDVFWLNAFVSHHHTREVTVAMLQLATALEMDWPDEALRAIDLVQTSLQDIENGDYFSLENFL